MAETSDYIAYRLERAGCSKKNLFTKPAVDAIWSASKGSPRTINVLCDHALVTAFAMGMKEVEGPAAREAVNDVMCLRLREPPIRKPGPYLVNHFESRQDPPNGRSSRFTSLTTLDGKLSGSRESSRAWWISVSSCTTAFTTPPPDS